MDGYRYRETLRAAATQIAANRGEFPAGAWKAFRKLFLQERRDWKRPGAPRIGWKRGELAEVVLALLGRGDFKEEWGDVGYYVAQTWKAAWWLYAVVTPEEIIRAAVVKFTQRAGEGQKERDDEDE